jgi:circadian clock protein KaiC
MIPVSSMSLDQALSPERVSSGNERIDGLLGGGFRRGSCVLLAGASGTGKTTLACSVALETCRRAKKALFVGYEQSAPALLADMAAVGTDLRPAIESGALRILAPVPESAGTEEHLLTILDALEESAPDLLVVDAVSACDRMGTGQASFDFLVRLLSTCRARGITCLYTNQIQENDAITRISGAGISSVVDTLVVLQYQDDGRVLGRRLLIVKSRGSRHSMQYHPFAITGDGIALDPPSGPSGPKGRGRVRP